MPYYWQTKTGKRIKQPNVCLHPALCTHKGLCMARFDRAYQFFSFVNWLESDGPGHTPKRYDGHAAKSARLPAERILVG